MDTLSAGSLLTLLAELCNEVLVFNGLASAHHSLISCNLWLAGQLDSQAVDTLSPGSLLAVLAWLCDEALDTPTVHSILDSRVETAVEAAKGLNKASAEERKRIKASFSVLSTPAQSADMLDVPTHCAQHAGLEGGNCCGSQQGCC